MQTSNEKILELLIHQQVNLMRYTRGLSARVAALLEGSEEPLQQALLKHANRITREDFHTVGGRKKLAKMDAEVAALREKAWDTIDALVVEEMAALAAAEAATTAAVINGAVPVVLGLSVPSAAHLSRVALATPFEGRVLKNWLKRSKFADSERITKIVKVGIAQGQTLQQVVNRATGTKRMGYKDGVSRKAKRDMEALIITASSSIQNAARAELYAENSDVFEEEFFAATLDVRTTLQCATLDGKRFKCGQGPMPPLHFRCRSLRLPYINPNNLLNRGFDANTEQEVLNRFTKKNGLPQVNNYKELPYGTKTAYTKFARQARKDLIGQVPATTTFPEWFKNQRPSFQDAYLGKTRAQLYRDGKLPLRGFVSPTGEVYTLEQLAKKGLSLK